MHCLSLCIAFQFNNTKLEYTTLALTKCLYFSVLPTGKSDLSHCYKLTPLQLHHATVPCSFADFGRDLPWEIGNIVLHVFYPCISVVLALFALQIFCLFIFTILFRKTNTPKDDPKKMDVALNEDPACKVRRKFYF